MYVMCVYALRRLRVYIMYARYVCLARMLFCVYVCIYVCMYGLVRSARVRYVFYVYFVGMICVYVRYVLYVSTLGMCVMCACCVHMFLCKDATYLFIRCMCVLYVC